MIARAGAGPQPIAPEELTNDNGEGVDRLREAIEVLVSHKAKSAAKSMGESIKSEVGFFVIDALFDINLRYA